MVWEQIPMQLEGKQKGTVAAKSSQSLNTPELLREGFLPCTRYS
jgi:hypothetical protein